MKASIEIRERNNEVQSIKIEFESGKTFDVRVYPSGELEINGGFSGALLIKPCVTNEIVVKHEH